MQMLFLFLFLITPIAWAHPLDLGILRIETGSANILQLDLNQNLVAQIMGLTPPLREGDLKTNSERIYQTILASTQIKLVGHDCKLESPSVESIGQSIRIVAVINCGIPITGELSVSFPFVKLKEIPKTFEILAVIKTSTNEQLKTLKGGADILEVNLEESRGFFEFVILGLDHIGVTPSEWRGMDGFHLPEGIDHILFIIALIIVGGGMIELIKTATGFTVGHSITLAMASFQWLRLNSSWVESIIALSIAYVAFESLFRKAPKHRWRVACLFGLIHGFGFATVLGDLNLKGWELFQGLIGFNVGIELGQVFIVLLALPILMALEKKPHIKSYFVKIVSIVIGVISSYWFYQRSFV